MVDDAIAHAAVNTQTICTRKICQERSATMEANGRSKESTAQEMAKALVGMFQGWHVSNQQALGRSLAAIIPQNCANGKQIAEHIQKSKAVMMEPNTELSVMGQGTGNFEPLTINLRGGSSHCATTVMTIKGYFVPAVRYLRAKAIFLNKLEMYRLSVKSSLKKPPPGSLGDLKLEFTKGYPNEMLKDELSGLLIHCIELAKKTDECTNSSWRDHRSRLAITAQFDEATLNLLYMKLK